MLGETEFILKQSDRGVFGLVRKAKDWNRKKRIKVVLAEKGEEAYRGSREMKTVHNIVSSLSAKEKKNLRGYLETLRNRAPREPGVNRQLPFHWDCCFSSPQLNNILHILLGNDSGKLLSLSHCHIGGQTPALSFLTPYLAVR